MAQSSTASNDLKTRITKGVICLVIAAVIYFLPTPKGVDPRGMHMLGIFAGTIVALILQPLPTAASALIGLTLAMLTGAMLPKGEAFSAFHSPAIWLIVAAFFLAQGFVKTGLGKRIALAFLTKLGGSSLGISYGLAATDFILSPATPSNTARLGGILFPIITSIAHVQGSTPDTTESRHRLGAFLSMTATCVNAVTSAIFLTAMAGGPVAVALVAKKNIHIDWGTWAIAGLVPGIVALIVVPLVCYLVFAPKLKKMPQGTADAKKQLKEMGKFSRNEIIMLVAFIVMLILWIIGSKIHMSATTVAFLGVAALLLTGVLTWGDLASNKSAWQTLLFFGVLVGMASQLAKLKVIDWLGHLISEAVHGMPWPLVLLVLVAVYILMHYLFASQLAQVVAVYPLFVGVGVAAGAPPVACALLLASVAALVGCMTHYACGPAALVYGSGYVSVPEFIRVGLVIVIVSALIWCVVGMGWWHIIGLW